MSSKCRVVRVVLVATALVACAASSADALTWTCEAIARKGSLDPTGRVLAGKFGKKRHGGPAINSDGDVAFFATPKGGPRRLYLYPNGGAPTVLAEAGGAAPGGGAFEQFRQPSINDAGDVAFLATLDTGAGIFVDPAAGAPVAVARLGDAAPGGGTYATFDGLARIDAAGAVAFLATVAGGPSGVFLWDAGSMTTTSIARVGDATLDGREICSFVAPAVGLGATATAFQVGTKVSCADAFEAELVGVYRDTGFGIDRVALAGDATPVPGTTYAGFLGDPDLNASDQILFRATLTGAASGTGLFLFDPAGPATTTLARTGDAAPTGGGLRTITEPSLTDGARAGFRANVAPDPDHEGIFLYDGIDEAVVTRLSAVPAGIFLPGSKYQKIFEEIGVSRSGAWVTYSATVKQPPGSGGSKVGLFRCEGS
ncbi:MAG: hypothetical protein IT294_00875 [Deltaproteobacteria bacterium]|nr:hypothetical protein [Deltaproteobacteria bacterium]